MTDLLPIAAAAVGPATAALLGCTGLAKVARPARSDAPAALVAALDSTAKAVSLLRAVGVIELLVAVGLVVAPRSAGVPVAALGATFVGYLWWARRMAPRSSCGCGGTPTPITWRVFVRAGVLSSAGLLVAAVDRQWWATAAASPWLVSAVFACWLAGYAAVSPELDRYWLLPLRQLRLRLLGHPLASHEGSTSTAAASVELLESSLAWRSTAHLVRSSLVDHWVSDGWCILRYAGRYRADDGTRPATVVFAVPADPPADPQETAIRVSVVDDRTGEVLAEPPPAPEPAAVR